MALKKGLELGRRPFIGVGPLVRCFGHSSDCGPYDVNCLSSEYNYGTVCIGLVLYSHHGQTVPQFTIQFSMQHTSLFAPFFPLTAVL